MFLSGHARYDLKIETYAHTFPVLKCRLRKETVIIGFPVSETSPVSVKSNAGHKG